MQPYSLFISDLHLCEDRPHLTAALERFLVTHGGDCEALYILGDLFESWIGDDDDSPGHRRVMEALRNFSAAGSGLYFMHGNRDFLLGTQFAHHVGGSLLEECSVIDLYGEPTLLLHGDSLCIDDTAYMAFRQQVRNSIWQQEMLARPLADRRLIASMLRIKSQQQNANKAENIMDVNAQEVARVMHAQGVRQMIHGHTHRPAVHQVRDGEHELGKRWVLGDWGTRGWQIRATPGEGLSLEDFAI